MSAPAFTDYPAYRVSKDGLVYSLTGWRGQSQRVLRAFADDDGYLRVRMVDTKGIRRKRSVHRLVAEVHIGPPPSPDHEVCHINGDPADNRVENLRWGTRKDNAADRGTHGRTCHGVEHSEAIAAGRVKAGQRRRLIASAPDLYEALLDVLTAATGGTNGRNITEATRLVECAVIARAALAKADGGES